MIWSEIGGRQIGDGCPVWVVAELGINAGGHMPTMLQMVDYAAQSWADAVKIQVMDPREALPEDTRLSTRPTPWGEMWYPDYREQFEFNDFDLKAIVERCQLRELTWFPSVCDIPSLRRVLKHEPPCLKIPSAFINRPDLLEAAAETGLPLILSTGGCDMRDVFRALNTIPEANVLLMHCTSAYPTEPRDVNLRAILSLRHETERLVGYSGHERGYAPTLAAVAMGAVAVERHFTLSRRLWGNDQRCSLEPDEFARMEKGIRDIEEALGDGRKRALRCEEPTMRKFRGVCPQSLNTVLTNGAALVQDT